MRGARFEDNGHYIGHDEPSVKFISHAAGSYPENPCTPDSDTNSGLISDPNAAGSAFMELRFYPPGFAPFTDSVSCTRHQWCAALTIDSLESQFNFVNLNAACEEPVNFAFLQRNGVPAGPPGPQLADLATNTPNGQAVPAPARRCWPTRRSPVTARRSACGSGRSPGPAAVLRRPGRAW